MRLDQLYAPSAEQWKRSIPIWTGGYCDDDESLRENEKGNGTRFQTYLQKYEASLNSEEASGIDFVSYLTSLCLPVQIESRRLV